MRDSSRVVGRSQSSSRYTMPAVSVSHLAKSYGDVVAVKDVSFEVEKGEVFALLGPNGAGKTTTIEILEGFRDRSGGEVQTLGVDPSNRATQRWLRTRIGVVLQELAVEPFYSVRQVLTRNAGYYPSPRPVDEVIELIGLQGEGRSAGQEALGRTAAPARRRTRHHRQSRIAVSRRAHDRPRPFRSTRFVGSDSPAGRLRHHRSVDHPLHGRGGGPGRQGRRPLRGRDRGQRHAHFHRWSRLGHGDDPIHPARGSVGVRHPGADTDGRGRHRADLDGGRTAGSCTSSPVGPSSTATSCPGWP